MRRTRPVSGYLIYAKENRESLKATHPTFGDQARALMRMWIRLPVDERRVYENKAANHNILNGLSGRVEEISLNNQSAP